jgi:very-short-patch-repair endonuclease
MSKKLTTSDFILRAINVHALKYDYSMVEYDGRRKHINILCKEHGIFSQVPYKHLDGVGCPLCSNRVKSNTTEFIKKSKKIHGDVYDYSKVNYEYSDKLITIICKEHGDFLQQPGVHLKGAGCQKCKRVKQTKTSKYFVEKALQIHGDIYDYSKVQYSRAVDPVTIVCKKHGEFTQTPHNHIKGTGCPTCSESKGERKLSLILDNNHIQYEKQKTFVGCMSKGKKKCRKYPFDFYLPKYNLVIEFDGIQHFQPVNFWGGKDSFESQKVRDEIKNQFCKDMGINIIRIPYTMKNNDVESFIKKELGITS